MIDSIIPLVASFIDPDFLQFGFFPIFAGYFVVSVPGLLRAFTRWR